jgi:hypothetical protein
MVYKIGNKYFLSAGMKTKTIKEWKNNDLYLGLEQIFTPKFNFW